MPSNGKYRTPPPSTPYTNTYRKENNPVISTARAIGRVEKLLIFYLFVALNEYIDN